MRTRRSGTALGTNGSTGVASARRRSRFVSRTTARRSCAGLSTTSPGTTGGRGGWAEWVGGRNGVGPSSASTCPSCQLCSFLYRAEASWPPLRKSASRRRPAHPPRRPTCAGAGCLRSPLVASPAEVVMAAAQRPPDFGGRGGRNRTLRKPADAFDGATRHRLKMRLHPRLPTSRSLSEETHRPRAVARAGPFAAQPRSSQPATTGAAASKVAAL
jgi:hypothetical protein